MSLFIVKPLGGHSGCSINLVQGNGRIFVRKLSSGLSYNFRLKKQCKKQSLFNPRFNVSAPKILECDYENGIFYFDMEFVQGKTLAEYTSAVRITEIADLIRCLFNSLYMENTEKNLHAKDIFLKKIQSLENNLPNLYRGREIFSLLKSYDWSKVYKSPCHGDLTLENILITSEKKIYLIDFLDSFYNSWMIDVAKLLQDLELKWSFRNAEPDSNRDLRLQVAKEALIEEIMCTDNGNEKIMTIYHILLMNIVRIYPYTKDEKTLKFLDSAIDKVINIIDKKTGVCL